MAGGVTDGRERAQHVKDPGFNSQHQNQTNNNNKQTSKAEANSDTLQEYHGR